jgi:hypothetical protein
MHPLGEILMKWAALSAPALKAPALVELREMDSATGRLFFFFNHADKAADVEFSENLARPASAVHEIVTGTNEKPNGTRFTVNTQVPAQAVRIYRIDD